MAAAGGVDALVCAVRAAPTSATIVETACGVLARMTKPHDCDHSAPNGAPCAESFVAAIGASAAAPALLDALDALVVEAADARDSWTDDDRADRASRAGSLDNESVGTSGTAADPLLRAGEQLASVLRALCGTQKRRILGDACPCARLG